MKEANIDGLRIQATKEDVEKVCRQILDLLELNQIPPMMAILGMWNVILLTFKVKFKFEYQEFDKTIQDLMKESKENWNP